MTANLAAVRSALAHPVEFGAEGAPPEDDGTPPRAMPDDCPVVPVGTEDGVFWFLSALGELRGLTADKVANKHIVGLFAPFSRYLEETWPRRKQVAVTGPDGKKLLDKEGNAVLEWITTGWDTEAVTMLLMDVAAQRGVWNAEEEVRGRGAWLDDDGGLILHCGNHLLMGGRWIRPGLHDGLVYPTAPGIPLPAAEAEVSAAALCPELVGSLRARGVAIAADASPAVLLVECLRTWNWARPHLDPFLLAGWLGAAMIGGALDYRPIAWLTGDKATGKSSLQKLIGYLFDGGIVQSPNASEAGVRQRIGQQSLPVAIDEAEASDDNRKMLDLVTLARLAATSQGSILRGGQDHKGHEFRATNCFLFSSILVPPITPADRSRMAMLELGRLPDGAREPRLDKRELNALGAWLRRRLVDRWADWPAVIEAYRDTLITIAGHGGRATDQFGTLLAAKHLLLDDAHPDPEELATWGGRLSARELAETADLVDDAEEALAWLATSQVQLDRGGTPRTIAEWILQASEPDGAGASVDVADRRRQGNEALGRIGLRVLTIKPAKAGEAGERVGASERARAGERARPVPGRTYLAVASAHQGLARVFLGSRWSGGVWAQAMRRVAGAVSDQQRIGGASLKCALVPVEAVATREDPAAVAAELAREWERA